LAAVTCVHLEDYNLACLTNQWRGRHEHSINQHLAKATQAALTKILPGKEDRFGK
jgi:hypothetical protein